MNSVETEVKQPPTCEGCKTMEPNQMAHMDPGGCLYEGFDEDEEYVVVSASLVSTIAK